MKFFYIISKKLKEKRLIWSSLESEDSLPLKKCLIVTDQQGMEILKHTKTYQNCSSLYAIINYEQYTNFTSLILNVLRELYGIQKFTILLVAIDPGQKDIGIAYFLDQTLIYTEIVHSTEKVIQRINMSAESFNPPKIELKIGKGSIRSLRDMLRALFEQNAIISPFHVYLVDERGSSKQNGIQVHDIKAFYPGYKKSITRDEQAAIIIGYRLGEELKEGDLEYIFNKEAQKAELKHIQRISRKKSNGKLSLSRDLANEVYQGTLSIEEAIGIQEKKKTCRDSDADSAETDSD